MSGRRAARGAIAFLVLFAAAAPFRWAFGGPADNARISALIFRNECAGRIECLTSWNAGEEFASLGIGHFIWYPAGTTESAKRFSESFPALLRFMRRNGVKVPVWLEHASGCPWPNRRAFMRARKTKKMRELRNFLTESMPIQADFMQRRINNALSRMLTGRPEAERRHLRRQFARVAESPAGMYALTDYVNFKGEGVNPKERYRGKGWGLLQVLEHMHGQQPGMAAMIEFSDVANMLLTRRVALSPPERREVRWLAGWRKRLRSYVTEARRRQHKQ